MDIWTLIGSGCDLHCLPNLCGGSRNGKRLARTADLGNSRLLANAEELSGFDFARLADVRALKPGLLYRYQSDGVAFLLSKKRAVLGDDMGLGKTRQAIVSMQMGAPEGKILVVCPAALKLNWRREILLVDPGAAVEVIGSTVPAAGEPRWVIINYDLLGKHASRLHDVGWAGVALEDGQPGGGDHASEGRHKPAASQVGLVYAQRDADGCEEGAEHSGKAHIPDLVVDPAFSDVDVHCLLSFEDK